MVIKFSQSYRGKEGGGITKLNVMGKVLAKNKK